MEIILQAFEEFRKSFPGRKRGYKTELAQFQKHKDWQEVIGELLPAVEREVDWRARMKAVGGFVPEWKHLKTWLNQRCWEDEQPEVKGKKMTLQEKLIEIWAN